MKFTVQDVETIQSYLHKDYTGCKIKVHNSRFSFVKRILFNYPKWNFMSKLNHIIGVLCIGKAYGCYTEKVELMQVFNFHINEFEKGEELWTFIQVVPHELRHYWQDKNNKFSNPNSECDAVAFQLRMINRKEFIDYVESYFGTKV